MIKKIRYSIEALTLSIFMIISKLLPLDWASAMGGFIGRTLGPRMAVSRKAKAHLQIAFPDIDESRINEIITGMWDNLGRVMMEYPHLTKIGKERTEIVGTDILERYRSQPTLIISGHFANWECCPPALYLQHNHQASPIYRAPNNPLSDKMLEYTRSLAGKIKAIPKSKSGTRHIFNALKEGRFIGMLLDQKYNEGVAVNFFGKPAMTSPIFVQLAQKFNCPVIPLRIERTNGANFKITIEEPIDIRGKTPETVISEIHTMFEQWITDRPEQWLWLHKRWGNLK